MLASQLCVTMTWIVLAR